jgi:preprotein translocase subunit SecA
LGLKKERSKERDYHFVFEKQGHISDKASKVIKPPRKKKKIGRNDPCPCGSGKKYKKCCLK